MCLGEIRVYNTLLQSNQETITAQGGAILEGEWLVVCDYPTRRFDQLF